jgi:hypothetical protein
LVVEGDFGRPYFYLWSPRCGFSRAQLPYKSCAKKLCDRPAKRLRFGRFLSFSPVGLNSENAPNNLTERRFRGYWDQTDKKESNERVRFRAVHNLIAEEVALRKQNRPKIGKHLVAEFGDGKWYSPNTMAKHLGVEADLVEATLTTMRALRGTYGAKSERKQVGKGYHYRIFKTDKTIGSAELVEKLTPIIEKLMVEGKKNAATASPGSVLILAGSLKHLLDEWSE